jgi:hypothetical protein
MKLDAYATTIRGSMRLTVSTMTRAIEVDPLHPQAKGSSSTAAYPSGLPVESGRGAALLPLE